MILRVTMTVLAVVLALDASAAPRKKTVPAPAATSAAPGPSVPDVSTLTAVQALAQLEELYRALEYEQVIPVAAAVLTRTDLTEQQRLEAYRLQGSARAIVEDPVDAERPFRLLLRARPDYDLPAETPPKILAVFRKVQSEEKALTSQLREVERKRVVANLRLSGEPASQAQGGRPVVFAYRVRDTAGVVESVRVLYRREGQRAFSALALERAESGEWRGLIPGEFTADEKGFVLEYVTETADREGPLLVAGSEASPQRITVAPGQVPVKSFKPIPQPLFWSSVGLTGAAGVATGVLAGLFWQEQSAFTRAVSAPQVQGAELVAQINRGQTWATATNVLLVSTAVALAATLILLPLTRFFDD